MEEKGQQRWVQGHHLLEVSPLGVLVWDCVTPFCKISTPPRIAREGFVGAKGLSP